MRRPQSPTLSCGSQASPAQTRCVNVSPHAHGESPTECVLAHPLAVCDLLSLPHRSRALHSAGVPEKAVSTKVPQKN